MTAPENENGEHHTEKKKRSSNSAPTPPSKMTEQGRRMSYMLDPEGSGAFRTPSSSKNVRLSQEESKGTAAIRVIEEENQNSILPHTSEFSVDDEQSTNSTSSPATVADRRDSAVQQIAAKENALVYYARILVMTVLILSAAIVGFLTFQYVSNEEEDDYIAQFQNDAKELIDISRANGENTLAVLEIFATLLSSNARRSQPRAEWPIFTQGDFEEFGTSSRALSGTLLLAFTPLVPNATRAQWEEYSVANQWWIREGLDSLGLTEVVPPDITPYIYRKTIRNFIPEFDAEVYSPVWQMSPAPTDTSVVNFNLFNHPTFRRLVEFAIHARQPAISEVLDTSLVFGTSAPQKGAHPQSITVLPVFRDPDQTESDIVGHVVAVIPWGRFFQGILQEGHDGVYAVLEESCGNSFTYVIHGQTATFLGEGDLHEKAYDDLAQSTDFVAYDGDLTGISGLQDHCQYTITVYPSAEFEEDYQSQDPVFFTVGVVFVFLFTSAVFVIYDFCVSKRQHKVNAVAVKSNAIVTSLFPEQVRDKLFQNDDKKAKGGASKFKHQGNVSAAAAAAGIDVEASGNDDDDMHDEMGMAEDSPPIADLFPSATVLFMDIAGFTAWSSQREPSQVFILLETIYRSFDKMAKQRRVFKVETIGDCYVAVCGLPEPNDDHATVMARFARECMEKMNRLARKLETSLGPDTADLAIRAGMHSGPVTAGVLRGDRARFQLFGDTVNTAARMESTGIKKKIQVSQETAELIVAAEKSSWIKPREDIVHAKGKGELQTFWLLPKKEMSTYTPSEGTSEAETDVQGGDWLRGADDDYSVSSNPEVVAVENERIKRLIDYTSDMLLQILKKIAAKRANAAPRSMQDLNEMCALEDSIGKSGICLDEVVEVIELPGFDSAAYSTKDVTLDEEAEKQVYNYVEMIATMYRANSFHNFDHASHVTQSVSKLLSRIVAVKHIEEAEQLHDHTYGITSDPLTQFAIVFSSLIHDVDHRGVPNFVLAKEDPALGALYHNQAVAEQNSVDVAWNLLMDPAFEVFRRAIYSNPSELKRFRQLVVNSLMATDIFDKQLGALRKQRWENAFFGEHKDEDPQISTNRKATIVIEHIIQASDVSHTMQHWHVYSKWNHKLFHESFSAYCHGRTDKDPTDSWYKGELWFFDNYVIPLAHKLKDCGVFGVSSDEYLNYAMANRREWEKKGKDVVVENFERYKKALRHRDESNVGVFDSAPLPSHN